MGADDRISRLRLWLEGREEATYERGKSSSSETHIFVTTDLFESVKAMDIQHGKTRLTIPSETVPTMTGRHNKIIWAIRLHGEIAGWPDLTEEFPIVVRPLAVKEGA